MCKRQKGVWEWEGEEVCTEAGLPCNINHDKSSYTWRDVSAILKSVCWVAKPITRLHS